MTQGSANQRCCFVLAVTVSHLHWATVVAETIARWEATTPVLIFVTDIRQAVLDSHSWPVGSNVTLIGGDRLSRIGFAESRHYFNGLEMSGPAKIYGLEFALTEAGYEKAIFLDADIHVTGSFDSVWDQLEKACAVVTPHICSPLPEDGQSPDNLEISSYGFINGGFWGLSRKPELPEIMSFMKHQVLHFGFFLPGAMSWAAEQTWMTALPFTFPHATRVLGDPGLNVAYWNLHERRLETIDEQATSNGKPLIFLHLSGFKPQTPDRLTSFQTRPPSEQNARFLSPFLDAQAAALNRVKGQMPAVAPDFPCSKDGIWGRLRAYAGIYGRPHPLAGRIILASLADKAANMLSRLLRRAG